MKRLILAAAMASVLVAGRAEAQVRVGFVEPQRYTDAENRTGSGITLRVTLAEIRRILETYGARALAPGQSLSIDVLDIDLAGMDRFSGAAPYGLRYVSDVTPPSFRLRYTLSERGRTLISATETVTDMNFLMRYARSGGSATFYYEREVLRDWLQSRITLRRPPPR